MHAKQIYKIMIFWIFPPVSLFLQKLSIAQSTVLGEKTALCLVAQAASLKSAHWEQGIVY